MAADWLWPNPTDGSFYFINPSQSGGEPMQGLTGQSVFNMNLRLGATWVVPIRNNQDVLNAREMEDLLLGQSGVVLVPAFDGKRANWPLDAATDERLDPAFVRDRSLDGTDYADPTIPDASAIVAAVTTGGAVNAMSIVVNISQGGLPKKGQWFGHKNRIYRVKTRTFGAGVWTIGFVPPLRYEAEIGDAVVFDEPVCEMVQAKDQGIRSLDKLVRTTLQLDFVEAPVEPV